MSLKKERYRIQGKIYYKIGEESVKDEDKCFVGQIWLLKNTLGEEFKMYISPGNKRYTIYTSEQKVLLKTFHITKVGE